MRTVALCILVGSAALAGCDPADVAGTYTVATTSDANECGLAFWNEGETQTGIPVVITQNGGVVQVEVQGLTGAGLSLATGSNRFNGNVGGNAIHAELIGSTTGRQGDCVYTLTLELDATLSGDTLQGEILWRPMTNGHPDCGILQTCGNVQRFNGVRPPR
jgi:hypothetical protein